MTGSWLCCIRAVFFAFIANHSSKSAPPVRQKYAHVFNSDVRFLLDRSKNTALEFRYRCPEIRFKHICAGKRNIRLSGTVPCTFGFAGRWSLPQIRVVLKEIRVENKYAKFLKKFEKKQSNVWRKTFNVWRSNVSMFGGSNVWRKCSNVCQMFGGKLSMRIKLGTNKAF